MRARDSGRAAPPCLRSSAALVAVAAVAAAAAVEGASAPAVLAGRALAPQSSARVPSSPSAGAPLTRSADSGGVDVRRCVWSCAACVGSSGTRSSSRPPSRCVSARSCAGSETVRQAATARRSIHSGSRLPRSSHNASACLPCASASSSASPPVAPMALCERSSSVSTLFARSISATCAAPASEIRLRARSRRRSVRLTCVSTCESSDAANGPRPWPRSESESAVLFRRIRSMTYSCWSSVSARLSEPGSPGTRRSSSASSPSTEQRDVSQRGACAARIEASIMPQNSSKSIEPLLS